MAISFVMLRSDGVPRIAFGACRDRGRDRKIDRSLTDAYTREVKQREREEIRGEGGSGERRGGEVTKSRERGAKAGESEERKRVRARSESG
eukprot:579505-Pleurochrysis_carterae.AAC.1